MKKQNTNVMAQFIMCVISKGIFGLINFTPADKFVGSGVFFITGKEVETGGFPTEHFIRRLEALKSFFNDFAGRFGEGKKIELNFISMFDVKFENPAAEEKFFGFVKNFFADIETFGFEFNFKGFEQFFGDFAQPDFSTTDNAFFFEIKEHFPFEEFDFDSEFTGFFADGEQDFAFPFNSRVTNPAIDVAN